MSQAKTGLFTETSLRQRPTINPRLYQAMDMLYMPLVELQSHLVQELAENPFLELLDADADDDEAGESDEESLEEDEIDWDELMLGDDPESPRSPYEPREYLEPIIVNAQNLRGHLTDQLGLLQLGERQQRIAEEIVGNIDDAGILSCTLEEVAAGVSDEQPEVGVLAEVEEVLRLIQSLDPPGVGARDLRECLLIQLDRLERGDSLAFRVVDRHFDALVGRRWQEIAELLGISPREVQDVADEVAKLDPKPGRRYSDDPDEYVIPDLAVEMIGGEYIVFVNDAGLPRLRLSQSYREVVADRANFVGRNKEFIANKLNGAQWLIQAIEQRRQTMLRVMRFIVAKQADFFEKGVQHLRPLTLREVADHIKMAESTVSRVTHDKYVQTPAGVHPLRFFFSAGLPTVTGTDISTRGVQALVANLVADEDPQRPLSDQAIVNLLKSEGIKIARRTVAKYRDQLGILSARMRKRF